MNLCRRTSGKVVTVGLASLTLAAAAILAGCGGRSTNVEFVTNPAPSITSISPVSGPTKGGTVVTITGQNFQMGATVTFGGTAATGVTVSGSTSIQAAAPSHAAGAVSVVVTNPDGQSATSPTNFTYNAPPPTITSISPTSGTTSGGTIVTITGTGFQTGATVTFGGLAAAVTVSSSTSIQATTPAHAGGAVSVIVTNPDGQSATSSTNFTYSATAPSITSISPTSGTTSGGTVVTITGSNFQTGAAVTFGGTSATSVTVSSSTSIQATTPAEAAGSVSVVVTNPDGQSATSPTTFTYTALSGSGPPTSYSSRTDTTTAQVPNPPPNVGGLVGANTVVTDPDFNNQIVRITDANTDPSMPNSLYETTEGSAALDIWNMNSSLFVILRGNGGAYPYSFNTSTLQASRLYVSSYPTTNGIVLEGQPVWSHTEANIMYAPDASANPIIDSYDFSNQTTPPSPQTFYNFSTSSNCVPALAGAVTFSVQGGSSADDQTFAMAYSTTGGQDTPAYAVAYRVGSGCSWYNTSTGQVGGDWGASGTVATSDLYEMHNIKISKDGNWAVITTGTCLSTSCSSLYLWQIGTLNTTPCVSGSGNDCSGHWTTGYTHWINDGGTPNSGSEQIRPFSSITGWSQLTNNYPADIGIFENHQSWSNANSTDTTPVFDGTASTVSPFPSAWYNEILGYATDGSGTVWRFAHNFITGESQIFSVAYGIGSVSQDGRFYIVSSDWMGTLGSVTGSSSCTIGSDCRSDVFVVALK